MNLPIGIGIIAYHATHDLIRCIQSIKAYTRGYDIVIGVCDNTEGNDNNVRITRELGGHIVHRGKNIGCAKGRNKIWSAFGASHPEMKHLVIVDQDVRVLPGWLDDMMELMNARVSAGMVAWPCANMGDRPVREDGCISKAASVCTLHLIEAIDAVGGWDPFFFMYRFDSLFADRMNNLGWRTYIQMKYYREGVAWKKQKGGIIHDHPHQGVKRNPRWLQLRAESDKYYKALMKKEGWKEFNPMTEPRHLWSLAPGNPLAPQ